MTSHKIYVQFHRNRCVLLKDMYWGMKNVSGFLSSDRRHLVCLASHYKLCIWCLIVVIEWKFSHHFISQSRVRAKANRIMHIFPCLAMSWVLIGSLIWTISACISTPACISTLASSAGGEIMNTFLTSLHLYEDLHFA